MGATTVRARRRAGAGGQDRRAVPQGRCAVPQGRCAVPQRGHLRLVARDGRRVRDGVPLLDTRPVRDAARRLAPGGWGALAVLAMLAGALALAVLLAGLAGGGGAQARPGVGAQAGPDRPAVAGHVVVAPGETLWEVARARAPRDSDPRAYLERLMATNGLEDPVVRPWTVLLLPVG